MGKTSAPKPSAGLPKSSTATVPNSGWSYKEEAGPGKFIYTNTLVYTAPKYQVSNEPFDERHHPALPHTGAIYRGFITEHQPPGATLLRFLFNPNQIDMSFELSQSLVALDQTAMVPTAGALGGHGVGFKIFFDRHYEVAYKRDLQGVNRDLDVLKRLVGVDENQGFMLAKVLRFVFSNQAMGFGTWYGIINSMSVSMGFFSKDMVPMMLEATINATFSPKVSDPKTLKWYTGEEPATTEEEK